MQIGDHKLDLVDALGILRNYAVNYADTVRFYDLAGNPEGILVPAAVPVQPMLLPLAISDASSL